MLDYLPIVAIAMSLLSLGVSFFGRSARSGSSMPGVAPVGGNETQLRELERRIARLERTLIELKEAPSVAAVSAPEPSLAAPELVGSDDRAPAVPDGQSAEGVVAHPPAVAQGQAPPVPFSPQHVASLYREWCREGVRPRSNGSIEVVHTTFSATSASSPDGNKRHVLRDADQLAEFVRFSPPGDASGLVFPNPDAHFTPVLAHVFPGLTRVDFEQRHSLAVVAPVTVRRRPDRQWELV